MLLVPDLVACFEALEEPDPEEADLAAVFLLVEAGFAEVLPDLDDEAGLAEVLLVWLEEAGLAEVLRV